MRASVFMPVRLLTCASVLACGMLTSVAFADQKAVDVAGRWDGAIEIPGSPLKMHVDLKHTGDAWEGHISIPAQNLKDLPLIDVAIGDGKVAFRIVGIPGDPSFAGTVSDDGQSIKGDFTQAGRQIAFSLARGRSPVGRAAEALHGFDAFIEQALKDWNTPGFAIGIVLEDEVVYAKGFGHRDVEKQLSVTADTLFAIGSTTKAFTTFVLATMVAEGIFDWDEPVATYLPGFGLFDEYASARLTGRDMVTHRSGLPRHDLSWYNHTSAPREEFVRRLRHLQPNEELRARWQYNNFMYLAAGYLAGELAGSTWEDVITSRIFDPLGMRRSNFCVDEMQRDADHALPYEEKDDVLKRTAFRKITNMGPAGSINSSVNDMAPWLRVHLNEGKLGERQILDRPLLRELHTPQMVIAALPEKPDTSPMSYALGWMTDSYRGHYRVQHGGGIDGFTTLVTLYPYDRLGIVAFANKSGSALPSLISRHAADRMLNLEEGNWIAEALQEYKVAKATQKEAKEKKGATRVPDTRPAHELDRYAGRYENPGYGILLIEMQDGQLVKQFNGITTPLDHWHYDTFRGLENPEDDTFEDLRITFRTNARGEVHALSVPFELLVDDIDFARLPDQRMTDPEYLARFAGKYMLATQILTVSVKGNALTLYVPGQPVYDLVPAGEDEFNLKGVNGFSMRFATAPDGTVGASLIQPNGVFELKRAEE